MGGQSVSLQTIQHYFNIDKFDRVVELAKDALQEHNQNEMLWFMLGYSNFQLDNYFEAEEQLIESMNLGYDKEVVFRVLGHTYMEMGQLKEAEDVFLETLRLNPNNAEAHASYAYLMKKTGHRKKAKQLLKKAMELDPSNSYVLRMYYQMEVMNSNDDLERIQVLEKYMQSGDSEISKHIQLGVTAIFRGKMKEARTHFRQAYLLNPENKELLEALEAMEIAAHPLLAPNRLIDRFGGPAVFWILYVAIIFILQLFKLHQLLVYWVIGYWI